MPGPPLPRPLLPRERGYLDKFVEYLVGDGPANRYALICRQCQSHNGMALREEFEYVAFRCAYCYYWNPARKQRPVAPRLPDAALSSSAISSSDSSEEQSGPESARQSRRNSVSSEQQSRRNSVSVAQGTGGEVKEEESLLSPENGVEDTVSQFENGSAAKVTDEGATDEEVLDLHSDAHIKTSPLEVLETENKVKEVELSNLDPNADEMDVDS